jgi:hypothetical protein
LASRLPGAGIQLAKQRIDSNRKAMELAQSVGGRIEQGRYWCLATVPGAAGLSALPFRAAAALGSGSGRQKEATVRNVNLVISAELWNAQPEHQPNQFLQSDWS